jgi:hypothetical protein
MGFIMKQHEAVIKIMEENGGFATLGYLYQNVLKNPNCEWKTKTPFASIRRIVQDGRFFFKIKPGLWALKDHKDEVLKQLSIDERSPSKQKEEFNHTYYQGLLTEIGNIKGYTTFVPNQDKNKMFLNKPLKEIAYLEEIYPFTYPELLQKAKTIDVIWFNERKFPSFLFEVEHTTAIYNSLLKFVELQDFNSKFRIVGLKNRENEYNQKIKAAAFKDIQLRTSFIDYENISKLHMKSYELYEIQRETGL